MKKGIVVEQKKRHTIMMTEDGEFYKTKKLDQVVGEETVFEPVSSNPFSFQGLFRIFQQRLSLKMATALALCFILIFPFYSWFAQEDVYAYVNIDINPSIELSLNKDYEVIAVKGLNEDGEQLLNSLSDWEKQSLQTVSSNILLLSQNMGYLYDDHNLLLGITFVDQINDSDHVIITDVSDSLQSEFQSINIASFEVPNEYRETAKQENTSMNIVYASQVLEDESTKVVDEESVEIEKIDDNGDDQVDNDANQGQPEEKTENEQNEKTGSINQNNLKIIEKFLLEAEDGKLPPGIQKKLERIGITKEEIEDSLLDEGEEDSEGHKDDVNDVDKEEENSNPPQDSSKSNKNDKNNEKGKNKHKNVEDDDEFIPPGLRDKNKGPGNENGKHDFVPPGLIDYQDENVDN